MRCDDGPAAPAVPTVDDVTGDYSLCGSPVSQTTSNEEGANKGKATFAGLTKTLYKVTETSAPSTVTKLAKPFVVTVPLGKADGTWINDVVVFPKNDTADKPGDPGTTDPSDPQTTPTVNYGSFRITKKDASTGDTPQPRDLQGLRVEQDRG